MTVFSRPDRPEWVNLQEAYQKWYELHQTEIDYAFELYIISESALQLFKDWCMFVMRITGCKTPHEALNIGKHIVNERIDIRIAYEFERYAVLEKKKQNMTDEYAKIRQYAEDAYMTLETYAQWYDEYRGLSKEMLLEALLCDN